jgi:hypothetical protein
MAETKDRETQRHPIDAEIEDIDRMGWQGQCCGEIANRWTLTHKFFNLSS